MQNQSKRELTFDTQLKTALCNSLSNYKYIGIDTEAQKESGLYDTSTNTLPLSYKETQRSCDQMIMVVISISLW